MSFNVFIVLDLNQATQNDPSVEQAINSLGPCCSFHRSLFYLSTEINPREVFRFVAARMNPNEHLAVINAQGGVVTNWDRPPIDEIRTIWMGA